MAETELSDIIKESLKSIKDFAGTETIIGDAITLPNGSTVIPISKIVMGFLSGGLDTVRRHESPTKQKHFTGGGGTGISILPVAFLIARPDGKIELMTISSPKYLNTVDKVTSLIERSPEILGDLIDTLTPEKTKEERERKLFKKKSEVS